MTLLKVTTNPGIVDKVWFWRVNQPTSCHCRRQIPMLYPIKEVQLELPTWAGDNLRLHKCLGTHRQMWHLQTDLEIIALCFLILHMSNKLSSQSRVATRFLTGAQKLMSLKSLKCEQALSTQRRQPSECQLWESPRISKWQRYQDRKNWNSLQVSWRQAHKKALTRALKQLNQSIWLLWDLANERHLKLLRKQLLIQKEIFK